MRYELTVLALLTCTAAGCVESNPYSPALPNERTTEQTKQSDEVQVSALVDDLRSTDDEVRRKAINSLTRLGPAAKPAVPALTEILKDRHARFRPSVAISFNQILPPYVDLVKVFPDLRYVGDIPPVDRWPADQRQKLAKAEEKAKAEAAKAIAVALPTLVAALTDENVYVRQYAALSLGACGPLASDSVPELTLALRDDNEAVRVSAVEALGRIGPAAESAVPHLLTYIKTYSRYDVRLPAENALKRIRVTDKPDAHNGL